MIVNSFLLYYKKQITSILLFFFTSSFKYRVIVAEKGKLGKLCSHAEKTQIE